MEKFVRFRGGINISRGATPKRAYSERKEGEFSYHLQGTGGSEEG